MMHADFIMARKYGMFGEGSLIQEKFAQEGFGAGSNQFYAVQRNVKSRISVIT